MPDQKLPTPEEMPEELWMVFDSKFRVWDRVAETSKEASEDRANYIAMHFRDRFIPVRVYPPQVTGATAKDELTYECEYCREFATKYRPDPDVGNPDFRWFYCDSHAPAEAVPLEDP